MRLLGITLASLLLHLTAIAQSAADLHGRWLKDGEGAERIELVFEGGFVLCAGERTPYSVPRAGWLVIGDPPQAELGFELRGDDLTLCIPWGNVTLHRIADAPAVPERKPAEPGDPFARTFTAPEVVLVLRGSEEAGYTGQLALEGTLHPVEARLVGRRLRGAFGEGDDRTKFTATLEGDELELSIRGGRDLTLRGDPLPPPALEGVYDGEVRHYEHPRGWFGIDVPKGWKVGALGDEGLTFDLGLDPNAMPEAIAGMLWGRLPEEDQNRPVARVLEKYVPALRTALREQGLIVGEPDGPIETYRGKDVPCAAARFVGRTTTGVECVVWCGTLLKRDSYLTVSGVYAADKEEKYLPKLKRLLATLEPRPPERNPKLEELLVGRTFSSSQYGRVVEAAHHASYAFSANNRVYRRLMSNIVSQPGLPGSSVDSEAYGRYEVCGDVLFLFFDTGQEAGEVLMDGGRVAGFRIGSAQYR